jgi:type IV pilus assembly protein PilE
MRFSSDFPAGHGKGFTLIELMIVVAIIGILMAIAIPQYDEYVLKGKLTEGMSILSELQVRQEQYYADNRTYLNGMTPRAAGQFFTTVSCVTANSGQTFTCTATAPTISFTYTITEASAKTTTKPDSSSASCWLKSSSGTC